MSSSRITDRRVWADRFASLTQRAAAVRLCAIVLLLGSLVLACGEDEGDDSGSAATATTATGSAVTVAPTTAATTAASPASSANADLAAIKTYTLDRAAEMKVGTSALAAGAADYYTAVEAADFDYQAAYDVDPEGMQALLARAREDWIVASTAYEASEGIVAGVPTLAYYDVWIDAGGTGEDDPTGALDWELELPNGDVLEKPGNFFHNLTEPAIWGTDEDFVALAVDLDGNGTEDFGETLPEANRFKASTEGLDGATTEMTEAIEAWEPNMGDAFTALAVMVPTMSEYFEQWKQSVFVAGPEAANEVAFVALSRLFDITGILSGLTLAFDQLSPTVAEVDTELDAQIQQGFDALIDHVEGLYDQEKAGTRFTAEQADLYGTEAQDMATQLAGQITQAAALLNVQIAE